MKCIPLPAVQRHGQVVPFGVLGKTVFYSLMSSFLPLPSDQFCLSKCRCKAVYYTVCNDFRVLKLESLELFCIVLELKFLIVEGRVMLARLQWY